MKLIPVSLRKADGHNCPSIKPGRTRYLAQIGGEFFVGRFERVWYGLTFDGWGYSGLQFDAPGTNSSEWEKIWMISK